MEFSSWSKQHIPTFLRWRTYSVLRAMAFARYFDKISFWMGVASLIMAILLSYWVYSVQEFNERLPNPTRNYLVGFPVASILIGLAHLVSVNAWPKKHIHRLLFGIVITLSLLFLDPAATAIVVGGPSLGLHWNRLRETQITLAVLGIALSCIVLGIYELTSIVDSATGLPFLILLW